MHYRRWLRANPKAPRRPRQALAVRFWTKVDKNGAVPEYAPHLGPCWWWLASRNDAGYGQFAVDDGKSKRMHRAHRVAYELLVGPIPDGLTLDHLCRVRHCVRPSHMDPVTKKVNILRGVGVSATHAAKTHCKWGHEFTPENTLLVVRKPPRGAERRCRICQLQRDANRPR